MSPMSTSLVLLLTIVHLPYPSLTEEVTKSVATQTLPTVKPPAPKTTSQPQRPPHSDSRIRRDSGEVERDKRIREFVGKRSVSSPEESEFYVLPEKNHEPFIPRTLPDEFYDTVDKRPRQFVGKRLREFVGKRSSEPDTSSSYDKRLREFVGKRDEDNSYLDKRLRDFVGKRGLLGDDEVFFEENKRPRQFVGKRRSEDNGDVWFSEEKRPRQFVGKRDLEDRDEIEVERRLREFVGKRAREFVGKRDFANEMLWLDEDSDSLDDKRAREFVGKRSGFNGESGVLDLVPADDGLDIGKRIREFVGKRSFDQDAGQKRATVGQSSGSDGTDVDLQLAKRIREFVGKRSVSDSDSMFLNVKRLREFVGKRKAYDVNQFIDETEARR
ncbi:unnamed protein product [Lymnaea stagnalis]|uniref:Uncharacterized protein n=1 Tax=Lymnaea stagnalis TaxID=6523 RepID=A0AAV2HC50_LYMST